jgi:hypothetical protein
VICDPLVHFGGVAALSFNCVPRFVDVRRDTYLMDTEEVERAVSPQTRALIVTNLWGLCAELDRIASICRERGIFMIEDCAHVIGARWKGRHAGTYGDIGVFSFQQGKHICTGDGCVMVTDRSDLHHKLYNEWAFKGESPSFLTLNFRMNEVTAAVGLGQLERFPDYLEATTGPVSGRGTGTGWTWAGSRRSAPRRGSGSGSASPNAPPPPSTCSASPPLTTGTTAPCAARITGDPTGSRTPNCPWPRTS